ncbi:MAG: phosphoenolpyruvate carboxylase [Bacteriovoracaceae bacterium]
MLAMSTIQPELKQLVFMSVKVLGEAIQEVHGQKLFKEIERLRVRMKKVRGEEAGLVEKELEAVYRSLSKTNTEDLRQIAKAFSLMLELINTCETAYRSYLLRDYEVAWEKKPRALIYVFTSHPTESRSPHFLQLMGKVEDLLIHALKTDIHSIHEKLLYLLKIAVRLDLAKNRRPQVHDEMDQIFHFVLSPKILLEQIHLKKKGLSVNFRTWVGGDKDGHPGVGAATMIESWNRSRHRFLEGINWHLRNFESELDLIPEGAAVKKELISFKASFRAMRVVRKDDGVRIRKFKERLDRLFDLSEKYELVSPHLEDVSRLVRLYPALVLPLEIREDSELIRNAVHDPKEPIYKMLLTLKDICDGINPKWYVRGFVISMCMTSEDMLAAVTITKRALGSMKIPIIPLFENEKGLKNAKEILTGAFVKAKLPAEHKKRWEGLYEVMVGYSDSSKENGVLPARLMIEDAVYDIEAFLLKHKLTPVFFHGSGGSTSRGGGTVLEQLSWWPKSALEIFKVTIQGEMVQRTFSNPMIMRSQVGKVVAGYEDVKPKRPHHPAVIKTFAQNIQIAYRDLVKDPSFQELTSKATPYDFLDLLKLGSRPTKRASPGEFSLRAIPWILCWTQTRLNLPVWWGCGHAWQALSKEDKKKFKAEYEKSPVIQTFIKNLGFTLVKVELGVWNFHLDHSSLPSEEKKRWKKIITEELELSRSFFHEVTGEENFVWFRPWLGESVYFRSSMIHPLNVIQKIALERGDRVLLRESVTGIACGMLTTG